ncbi:MAG: serine/threonine-protein kinase, partial [Solirubrobacterales bacterium]
MERTETLIFQPPEEGDDGHGPEVHRVVMGRYRLVRRLGAGGFGVVWEAHDEQLDRLVAVKTIGASNPEVAARAEREAQAAARLTHPGIVALYESAREPDAIHLVSELVFGGTLGELLADEALSDRDILRIGSALCGALAHAHARGVVHRDIKPANVMIPENAESEAAIVKLTDFGVARLAGDETITRNGDIVGTFSYMA